MPKLKQRLIILEQVELAVWLFGKVFDGYNSHCNLSNESQALGRHLLADKIAYIACMSSSWIAMLLLLYLLYGSKFCYGRSPKAQIA